MRHKVPGYEPIVFSLQDALLVPLVQAPVLPRMSVRAQFRV